MSIALRMSMVVLAGAAVSVIGCAQEQGTSGAPSASSHAAAAPSAAAPAPSPSVSAPAPSATAAKSTRPCPDGSTGDGTLNKPCDAKGTARLMEVTWTGKMTDTGPSFRVTNKSKLDILYGSIAAYFYDKAGKQLEVKDTKPRPKQVCSGKIFDGVMKAGEKAVITFSCVKKEHVPEGTVTVEGEMQMVGFPDASGAVDLYWRNNDLTPDARPKGGVK